MKKLSYIILLIFLLSQNTAFSKTWYVSTSGSDSGNGSSSNPYKTINKAANVVSAGDTVLISAGVYIEKNITPKTSGTQDKMIVFKPSPGTGEVIIKHPATSNDDVSPVFNLSGKKYIWIEGFCFKDFAYGQASVYISEGEGNVVINNRFENLGNGQVGSWNQNSVVWVYKSTRNVVSNNYFKNIFGDGISVNGQSSERNLVCNNTFIGFKGKLRSWGGSSLFSRAIDIQDMSTGNNVIALNYGENLYHLVWLDRDGSNNIIVRNFGDTGSGTIFNESRCAYNIVQENISINMKVGFMSAYYETTGWTIEPRWINNVAYKNEIGFNIHKSERDEFRNNIAFNNSDCNLSFTDEAFSNAPHIFKNNLWFTEGKTNSIKFKGKYVSVAEFQTSIGETDGLSVNPMFASTTSGSEDFMLSETSPAKNAGDNGLDLGAYAFYPKTAYGWDASLQFSGTVVSFENAISSVERGADVQITIRLNAASVNTISVDIKPVAGDAVIGNDFELSESTITFLPGETSKILTVTAKDSSKYDEIVALGFNNEVNANQGARNIHVLRVKKTPLPTAYAGPDQTVWDADNNGSEEIILDGSESTLANGTIISYEWFEGENQIASGEKTTVSLSTGFHIITLLVADDEGNTDSDEVIINVVENIGIWLEAECGAVGSLWNITTDPNASNNKYVTVKSGNNSADAAPANATGQISYTFNVNESGKYSMYARVICPNANDDSFWLKMDNGSFSRWNDITPSSTWIWVKYPNPYTLSTGSHTFTVGYREDGAKLDKLLFSTEDIELNDMGPEAGNCGSSVDLLSANNIGLYPNPVCETLFLALPEANTEITFYDITGNIILKEFATDKNININLSALKPGIYLMNAKTPNREYVKKIIKE